MQNDLKRVKTALQKMNFVGGTGTAKYNGGGWCPFWFVEVLTNDKQRFNLAILVEMGNPNSKHIRRISSNEIF